MAGFSSYKKEARVFPALSSPRMLKDSKTADMDYFRIGYFLLALPPLVVSKCALAGKS
jgi:hypothetical protein